MKNVKTEKNKKVISYKNQKLVWAFIFLAPWFFGLVLLFLYPLVESLIYSFSNVTISDSGISTSGIAFKNYIDVFNIHAIGGTFFKVELLTTILDAVVNLPVIVIFSLLMATLLNTEFKGRAIARAIFFIPVILNSATVLEAMSNLNLPAAAVDEKMFNIDFYLINAGLGEGTVTFLTGLVSRMTSIVTLSGIPILLFLASIQSIPSHLYEAAKMEGATTYEMFWLITFPNVTPHILTVLIYVLVDSFLTSSVTSYIQITLNARQSNYIGLTSAMSWIYTLVVLFIIGVVGMLAKTLKWGESHYAS
ncbi:carbohydrate ABC transporter permease [Haploplasma axanthum]|uniref:Inner membrane ABC transporter permease protein ycjO n=1 Tax=Haploplasma axanthum TaxID=29552 RepID=A0A449BD07_HAPAX|nr:sugar ABC transporter permease [Haploplasma axanthum]VEU80302.1 Inner membrane ABC transporter permease protein ycjO [Haploplasma axanthum]